MPVHNFVNNPTLGGTTPVLPSTPPLWPTLSQLAIMPRANNQDKHKFFKKLVTKQYQYKQEQ